MSQKKNYQTVALTDQDSLNRILDELERPEIEYVAFDIETNSAVEKTARTIGIGISYYEDEGIYFPFAEFNPQTNELVSLNEHDYEHSFVQELCAILMRKKLLMWGGVFDCTVMKNQYGIDLVPALYADVMMMKHTVDEERPFKLKEVAEIYKQEIGFTAEEAANQEQQDLKESIIRNGGKFTQKQKDIYKGDLPLVAKYCCADTDLTIKLFGYFQERLHNEGLLEFFYNQEVMPLYRKSTIPMKMHGCFIDVKYFKQLEKELESDILRLTDSIFKHIEEDIEPYVQELLDDAVKETKTGKFAERVLQYYNIPIPSNKKTGKPTLAKSALQSLLTVFPAHPALEWLLHQPRLIAAEVIEHEEVTDPDGTVRSVEKKVLKQIPDPKDTCKAIPADVRYAVKKQIFTENKPDLPHVFNLSSNDDISWLIFKCYGETPKSYSRETDKPQVDADSLETYDHLPFIKMLLELKKEEKLLSTYVKPILEMHIDGWLYPSMFQFGTTSGRYSCGGGLNLQTLPRFEKPKECPTCESRQVKITQEGLIKYKFVCGNCEEPQYLLNGAMIKKGFIAPKGYKVVNADFSSLEPRIFSWVCGDEGLKRVWREGLDLYSQIAIDVFGLQGVSARETDENYLKKKDPESRQKSKVFTLAVPYGANEWRIAQIAKVEPETAREWINNYLEAYPDLKYYMKNQEIEARSKAFVRTAFDRVRHLPKASTLYQRHGNDIYNKKRMQSRYGEEFGGKLYYEYRNQMNNAKNFPIQATAAHVCNAALIKLADLFAKHKIEGWIALQVHDEITCIVKDHHAELASRLLKESMEDNEITRQMDIPILAEPIIAMNFAEAK